MRVKTITSLQNPLIKELVLLLEKSKKRKESGLFIAEGLREISLCVKGNYSIQQLIYCPQKITLDNVVKATGVNTGLCEIIEVDDRVFEKLAYRNEIENAVIVARQKVHQLSAILAETIEKYKFSIVISGIEKPGNLGAILRSADATGTMVIVCDPTCDLYNPNVIRSSVGTVFTSDIFLGTQTEVIEYFKNNAYSYFTTFMQKNSRSFFDCELKNRSAVILGTESTGLGESWRDKGLGNINLPMMGIVDSLNVSVAASVIMYEALRQRSIG